jgi:hypothetical protein
VPAWQVHGPEFKCQYCKNKKSIIKNKTKDQKERLMEKKTVF